MITENLVDFIVAVVRKSLSIKTQWLIELSFITRDLLNSNHLCGGKTTKQTGLTL